MELALGNTMYAVGKNIINYLESLFNQLREIRILF